MKNLTSLLAIILCISLLMSACSKNTVPTTALTDETSKGSKNKNDKKRVWPDPGIDGNLKELPRVQDEFAGNLNYNWYTTVSIPEGYSAWAAFNTLGQSVKDQLIKTLKAPSDNADHRKLSALFSAAMDKDKRNAMGLVLYVAHLMHFLLLTA